MHEFLLSKVSEYVLECIYGGHAKDHETQCTMESNCC
jgi:hypothetical protein